MTLKTTILEIFIHKHRKGFQYNAQNLYLIQTCKRIKKFFPPGGGGGVCLYFQHSGGRGNRSPSPRPAQSTELAPGQPGTHREALPQNTKEQQQQQKEIPSHTSLHYRGECVKTGLIFNQFYSTKPKQ